MAWKFDSMIRLKDTQVKENIIVNDLKRLKTVWYGEN